MLVITGAQRSGTSFAINFFKQYGFDVGADFWHDDINGGLENVELSLFFRDYLGDPSFPFSDLPTGDWVRRHLTAIDYPVVKFSYLTMLPILPYIWHKFRGNKDTFLILHRDPESIIKSKARGSRFSTDSPLLNQPSNMISHNLVNSIRILELLGMKYKALCFPDLLSDYPRFQKTVGDLGISLEYYKGKEIWESLVDFSKVHF